MNRSVVALFLIVLASGALSARAQVVPSATARHVSIAAGGMASLFQPDFNGDWGPQYPIAQASNYPLIGMGAYVDVKFSRWVQIEAEGRWLRFNQYANIYQDNYLLGPRVPIHRFGKVTVYGKALIGFSRMNFDSLGEHGRFTDTAFGGGADIKLTKRISLRAIDVEYQYWPQWGNSTLSPYGASAGIGYRIF
jgi:hypothetical protein